MSNVRIRVTGGPWPERIGLEGCIVIPTPEQAKLYPFNGRAKNEVIVLIDDDPLNGPGTKFCDEPWSCAINKANIEIILPSWLPHYEPRNHVHIFPEEFTGIVRP